jgi:pimeloyl-ACP methyl ester carboxylesterase
VERLVLIDSPPKPETTFDLIVLFGTRDQLISPQSAQLFEMVPGASVVMVDGAGHSPMVEAPEKTLALIRDFLARPAP